MAYNSDGYIMIDFTEVDFRRTNQTIDGLYKRCVDVIGTNKFILVINANGRTPLPATCSFTNNQYVIDTCIYMFAISSNDNLFIRRNDVPASDIIDDSSISVDKTWSSNKIDTELDGKQDTLTAGDNISIVNNVISSKGVKKFTYKGTGTYPFTLKFPTSPELILSITGITNGGYKAFMYPVPKEFTNYIQYYCTSGGQNSGSAGGMITFNDDEVTLESSQNGAGRVFNVLNEDYTVYYI